MAVLNYRDPNTLEWVPIDMGSGGGLDQSVTDGLYVNLTGDRMTGDLNFANGSSINMEDTVGVNTISFPLGSVQSDGGNGRMDINATGQLHLNADDVLALHSAGSAIWFDGVTSRFLLSGNRVSEIADAVQDYDAVSLSQVTAVRAELVARTPPIIVLGPADPVPPGTAAGTVIMRTP